MQEFTLENASIGTTGVISRCLTPKRGDVYRLLEMGLCVGTSFTVIRKSRIFGALEVAIAGSRLCIANDLAKQFLAVGQPG